MNDDVALTVRLLKAFPGADIVELADDDLGGHALAYALAGWEVFPLRDKAPAISTDDGGRGLLDATTDLDQIAAWWTAMPWANIGGRVPAGCVVLDIDPRHKGDVTVERLERAHGPLPATRTCLTGGADRGRHLYYRHPGGKLTDKQLDGIDLRTHANYCVLPPSKTRRRYLWEAPAQPIIDMPAWLVALLRPARPAPVHRTRSVWDDIAIGRSGDSIADWYTETHTWGDVLGPHGWQVVDGDGEHDGSTWEHPTATARTSASIRHSLLFVYSTNTVFEPTGAEDPHGYTRFRAYAVLDHGGDLSAAARAAVEMRKAAA